MRPSEVSDLDCAIALAAGIVGDWWTLLIVRDIAGGTTRFEGLQRSLGVSRKVLTERLSRLVEDGVLQRVAYSRRPLRHDYLLTDAGQGLMPVLVALQDWGTRYVAGDGSLTATSAATSLEARRVQGLVGTRIPALTLAATAGESADPFAADQWTVAYCFPGAFAPGPQAYPSGWGDIPGAGGCTLESVTYRDRSHELVEAGAGVVGISTQRPDQLAAFAEHASLTFPLLSDQDNRLAAALRLPTFRAAGQLRLKRLTLLVDEARTIRAVQFPIPDPRESVAEALQLVRELRAAHDIDVAAGSP
jgi:DNA-binding HxlR family transcriptional regulator/peroxiredoxin